MVCLQYKTVWSVPERFRGELLTTGRYTNLPYFLMWSETVSVINLQTLNQCLTVHKNAPFLLLKFKNFLGRGTSSPPCPFNSPSLANTSGSSNAINSTCFPFKPHIVFSTLGAVVVKTQTGLLGSWLSCSMCGKGVDWNSLRLKWVPYTGNEQK